MLDRFELFVFVDHGGDTGDALSGFFGAFGGSGGGLVEEGGVDDGVGSGVGEFGEIFFIEIALIHITVIDLNNKMRI